MLVWKTTHRLGDMIGPADVQASVPDDEGYLVWVRAVPLPYSGNLLERLFGAWAVLWGRAYAAEWPAPRDLGRALHGDAWGEVAALSETQPEAEGE